jgi:molybdopterin/thiamine biosynthesis adenylyltransferase
LAAVREVVRATPLKGQPPGARPLESASANFLGLGSVGATAFVSAAQSGVGSIEGIDPDFYGEESFLTQPIEWRQAGQAKAWVQGQRAAAVNPTVRVLTAIGRGQDVPLRHFRRADVLVVAGDNAELVVWAGRVAAGLGKPLVQGAVHGETGTAILRGYALTDPDATCPACGQSRSVNAQGDSGGACDPFAARRRGGEPTRTLPALCQLAGQLLAAEAIKWLAGQRSLALQGEELTYCYWSHRSMKTELPRRASCEAGHDRWTLIDWTLPFHDTTIARLARELEWSDAPSELLVRSELPWVSFVLCDRCGRQNRVLQFARLGTPLPQCCCGASLAASPMGQRSIVPQEDLQRVWERDLGSLGLTGREAVALGRNDRWVYFFPNTNGGDGDDGVVGSLVRDSRSASVSAKEDGS